MQNMNNKNMIGKLDKQISLVREYQADDGNHGVCSTFREYATPRAYVFTGTGTENFKFQRVFAAGAFVFVIRNRADLDIKENDVIEYNGEKYNISHIARVSDREMYIAIETHLGNGI